MVLQDGQPLTKKAGGGSKKTREGRPKGVNGTKQTRCHFWDYKRFFVCGNV